MGLWALPLAGAAIAGAGMIGSASTQRQDYSEEMGTVIGAQENLGMNMGRVGSDFLAKHDMLFADALNQYHNDIAYQQDFRNRFGSDWAPLEDTQAQQLLSLAQDPNWQGVLHLAAQDANSALKYNQHLRDVYGGLLDGYASDMQKAREAYSGMDEAAAKAAQGEFDEEETMRNTYAPLYGKIVEDSQRDLGTEYAGMAGADMRSQQAAQTEQAQRDASRMGVDPTTMAGQMGKNAVSNAANTAGAMTRAQIQGDQERFGRMTAAAQTRRDPSTASRSFAAGRMAETDKAPMYANAVPNAGMGVLQSFNPYTTQSYAGSLGAARYMPSPTINYPYLGQLGMQGLQGYASTLKDIGGGFQGMQSSADAQYATQQKGWGNLTGAGLSMATYGMSNMTPSK